MYEITNLWLPGLKWARNECLLLPIFCMILNPNWPPQPILPWWKEGREWGKGGFGIGGGVLFGCDADTDRRRAHVNPRFAFPHKIFLTFATPGLNISCRPSLLRANLKDGYSVKDCLRFSIILSHCPSMMWQLSATSRDGKHTSYLSILVHRHII